MSRDRAQVMLAQRDAMSALPQRSSHARGRRSTTCARPSSPKTKRASTSSRRYRRMPLPRSSGGRASAPDGSSRQSSEARHKEAGSLRQFAYASAVTDARRNPAAPRLARRPRSDPAPGRGRDHRPGRRGQARLRERRRCPARRVRDRRRVHGDADRRGVRALRDVRRGRRAVSAGAAPRASGAQGDRDRAGDPLPRHEDGQRRLVGRARDTGLRRARRDPVRRELLPRRHGAAARRA